ncbi:uncharacterized protein LOC129000072 [Macrosteles quadrilineatus]|uniref:uncharacterized protein LOC129000072 n=1 Tax=Macrosteles quadrilineatus TaxID=74068 RepID=UPI0023E10561|nr:uncharacterized protein LOC129000072 [Macrosteles quadrilineatus]
MGQRISDLKGIFGTMEVKEVNDIVSGSNSTCYANSGNTIEQNNLSHDNNGNNQANFGVDDHFENIYSNNSESTRHSEDNGNSILPELRPSTAGLGLPANFVNQNSSEASAAAVLSVSQDGQACSISNDLKLCSKAMRHNGTQKCIGVSKDVSGGSSKKKRHHSWVLRFNCARLKSGSSSSAAGSENDIAEPNMGCDSCVCTGYRRTEDHHLGAGVVFGSTSLQQRKNESTVNSDSSSGEEERDCFLRTRPVIDLSKFNPEDYPIEDCDERARLERAREIAEGVDPPPGFRPAPHIQVVIPPELTVDNITALFQSAALSALSQLDVTQRVVHTQVDYIHCLVPDLLQITSCSFYWGKMDRYEAERLLEGRPEGTFLLRDSAQEEYLFSVSFRKYGRSLHARIEQWNHRFSFDSHDPGVFASSTVCGLIEHYKDPSCCMFFEPMLTIPLHRNFPFPLQHLCRAVICSKATYDGVSQLRLPKSLKSYLKEYHYKQRVRVRRFDSEQY